MARQYSILIKPGDENVTETHIREMVTAALETQATLLFVERVATLKELEDEMRLDVDGLLDDFDHLPALG